MTEVMDTSDILEVEEPDTSEKESSPEFEVLEITSRKEVSEGDEHLYEVHWKDGDITWEPVSNLSGASDALRRYLTTHHPEDKLLKLLSSLADSDEENAADSTNGVDKRLGWLARWHQKTTRGSTQYWLRKGEDEADVPRLLNPDLDPEPTGAPLEPEIVPDIDEPIDVTTTADVSGVLFSEGEETPGSGLRVRKRIRVYEETVRKFPHEELIGEDLENSQNKTIALWKSMLGGVLIVGCCVSFFVFLYSKHLDRTTQDSS